MNNINMFKRHYDDIPRYTTQIYGDVPTDRNAHTNKRMLMPLQRNMLEIDTSNTTQVDGEYKFLSRGDKYMTIIEVDMNVKIKVASFNFVYGVNGGRRFYEFRIRSLNKDNKPLVGDIIYNNHK